MANRSTFRKPGTIALTLATLLAASFAFLAYLDSHTHAQGRSGYLVSPALPTNISAQIDDPEFKKLQAGKYHKPLRVHVNYPGVQNPGLLPADQADLPDSTEVIGVHIEDQACAFVLSEMTRPERHVVNLMIKDSPISASYCNYTECVRVLTSDSTSEIPLGVGGLNVHFELVLLLHGERYNQTSADLPLRDVPFVRSSLGDWKRQYPKTKIYVGPTIPSVES